MFTTSGLLRVLLLIGGHFMVGIAVPDKILLTHVGDS